MKTTKSIDKIEAENKTKIKKETNAKFFK